MNELIALAKELGFTEAASLDPRILEPRAEVRAMCAADKCHAYGKNWTCPPECGDLALCTARIRSCTQRILLRAFAPWQTRSVPCIRMPCVWAPAAAGSAANALTPNPAGFRNGPAPPWRATDCLSAKFAVRPASPITMDKTPSPIRPASCFTRNRRAIPGGLRSERKPFSTKMRNHFPSPAYKAGFLAKRRKKAPCRRFFSPPGSISGRIEQKPPWGDGEKDVKCGKLAD